MPKIKVEVKVPSSEFCITTFACIYLKYDGDCRIFKKSLTKVFDNHTGYPNLKKCKACKEAEVEKWRHI